MMSDRHGDASGPGSREPSPQVVSALRASIPIALRPEQIRVGALYLCRHQLASTPRAIRRIIAKYDGLGQLAGGTVVYNQLKRDGSGWLRSTCCGRYLAPFIVGELSETEARMIGVARARATDACQMVERAIYERLALPPAQTAPAMAMSDV